MGGGGMNVSCLKRKLVFGDEEQIAAIKAIMRKIDAKEKQEKDLASGKLKKFKVIVTVGGSVDVIVIAKDTNDAR
jgi:hydroxyethylthiazole kinase-like sugar kinase family protein